MLNIKEPLTKLQKELKYCIPPTDKNIDEAYWLGVKAFAELMKQQMVGYAVNGICTNVLTEQKLNAMMKELQQENTNEEIGL